MKRLINTCLLLCLSAPVWALPQGQQRYEADEHSSKWDGDYSRLLCELRHEVPRYGLATFRQRAGGELEFTLKARQKPLSSGEAALSSRPPSWRHGAAVRRLETVEYHVGKTPFHFGEETARRMLSELEVGMYPSLEYADWVDGKDQVRVALSAVNVRRALGEFQACLTEVLPFDFEHVRDSLIHFAFGKAELDRKSRERLDELALYLSADPSVKQVSIKGHTDNKGFRSVNNRLSQRRAEAVRDYLIAAGVGEGRFSIRYYGESQPTASNRTSRGRALNRRVSVVLSR